MSGLLRPVRKMAKKKKLKWNRQVSKIPNPFHPAVALTKITFEPPIFCVDTIVENILSLCTLLVQQSCKCYRKPPRIVLRSGHQEVFSIRAVKCLPECCLLPVDISCTLLRSCDLRNANWSARLCEASLGIPLERHQCLTACTSPSVPSGESMKKRSSSLTRVSVSRAQTPTKSDKGTPEDQGG